MNTLPTESKMNDFLQSCMKGGALLRKIEDYKGYQIFDWNGSICVNKLEDGTDYLYIVALDDSKMCGHRIEREGTNNVESARAYIDWITE